MVWLSHVLSDCKCHAVILEFSKTFDDEDQVHVEVKDSISRKDRFAKLSQSASESWRHIDEPQKRRYQQMTTPTVVAPQAHERLHGRSRIAKFNTAARALHRMVLCLHVYLSLLCLPSSLLVLPFPSGALPVCVCSTKIFGAINSGRFFIFCFVLFYFIVCF